MSSNKKDDEIMLQHLLESMPIDEYEGRNAKEMQYLVYDPFCSNSPFSIKASINNEILTQVPFFCLIKHFLEIIAEQGSVKLSAKGFLPLKVVKSIYSQHFIREDYLFNDSDKNVKEFESLSATNARIVAEQAGLVKNRKNVMTLTKKGTQFLANDNNRALFVDILKVFTSKFNWSYNDGYGDNDIGQFGFAYTLDLISKYGSIARNADFYATKYREVFLPILNNSYGLEWPFTEKELNHCYALRSIERFMLWFGFVIVTEESEGNEFEYRIEKSNIFDLLFEVE